MRLPHALIKTFYQRDKQGPEATTWEQFINCIPTILTPAIYLIIFTLNTEVYWLKWSPGLGSLFELPDNASQLAAHQSRLGRIGAFHSFFQIGWPRLQPFTGCGKLEIKRLPFTPSFFPSSASLSLCSSSLRPAFPAHVIVWKACSLVHPPLTQLCFVFIWNSMENCKLISGWHLRHEKWMFFCYTKERGLKGPLKEEKVTVANF